MEGSGGGPMYGVVPSLPWKDLVKPRESPVRAAGFLAGI
jgi:hypothetical protein